MKRNANYIGYAIATCCSVFFSAYILSNRYALEFRDVDTYTYIVTFLVIAGIASLCDLLVLQGPRSTLKIFMAENKRINPRLGPLVMNGTMASAAFALAAFGQSHTTASNASLIFSANIIPTAFFAWLILKQIVSGKSMSSMVVVLIGLYIAVIGFERFHVNVGDYLILGAACIIGFTNTYMKSLITKYPSRVVADLRLITGAVAAGVFLLFHHVDFLTYDNLVFALIAGLFLFSSVSCIASAMRRININTAVVLAQTHIIMTPIAAVFLLDEKYHFSTFIGSIIMLAGVILFTWTTSLSAKKTEHTPL